MLQHKDGGVELECGAGEWRVRREGEWSVRREEEWRVTREGEDILNIKDDFYKL